MSEITLQPVQEVNIKIRDTIALIEAKIKSLPASLGEDPFPLKHSFAEGLYIREIFMPKGHFVVGKLHKDSYSNFMISGDVSVLAEGGSKRIQGPCHMISPPGTKRFGYTHEDTVWVTVHSNPFNITDIEKLEEMIHTKDYEEVSYKAVDINTPCLEFDEFVLDLAMAEFDDIKFRELTKNVFAAEKPGFWSDWTEEQQKIYMSGDWEVFSRSRGYSEEEIEELREWITMKEDAEAFGLNALSSVKDLCINKAMEQVHADTRGEIHKSSHMPSNKKIPYK